MNSKVMNAEEMLDRYIHEVGERLPSKSRADIEKELRSLIQDAVDEQSSPDSELATSDVMASVLKEFGEPSVIAARYRPAEVLIGSTLFPSYRIALTITLSIVIVIQMVGVVLSLVENQAISWTESLPHLWGSFWESLLINAAIITLIFAVIERVAGESLSASAKKKNTTPKAWDPYQLSPVKDPNRINKGGLIAGCVVQLFLIGGLNFFYDSVGYIDLSAERLGIIGMLAPEFLQVVPWLTAAWALDILLNLFVLVQGRWNGLTRWLEVATTVFGLYVLARILMIDTIMIVPIFTTVAKLTVGILIVVVAFDLVGKLYRLLTQSNFRIPAGMTASIFP